MYFMNMVNDMWHTWKQEKTARRKERIERREAKVGAEEEEGGGEKEEEQRGNKKKSYDWGQLAVTIRLEFRFYYRCSRDFSSCKVIVKRIS